MVLRCTCILEAAASQRVNHHTVHPWVELHLRVLEVRQTHLVGQTWIRQSGRSCLSEPRAWCLSQVSLLLCSHSPIAVPLSDHEACCYVSFPLPVFKGRVTSAHCPPGVRSYVHLRSLSLSLHEVQFTFLRSLFNYISNLQSKQKGPRPVAVTASQSGASSHR
jgi:hypothetical protein